MVQREGSIEIETCMFVKCEIRILLPRLFWPIVIKQATGIYSLPQLLHQLWCLGKSAQLRSDWEFGLLHLVRLLYTLSKVIHPKYYKQIADFSNFARVCILLLLVVHNVQLISQLPRQIFHCNKSETTVNFGFEVFF